MKYDWTFIAICKIYKKSLSTHHYISIPFYQEKNINVNRK